MPESITPTRLWKDRRIILGGSVGVCLVLIVILILAGRSGTDASAATSTVRPTGAVGQAPKESPASTETYPIPPEAIAAEDSLPTTQVPAKVSRLAPAPSEEGDLGKTGGQRTKLARERIALRRVPSSPRALSTASRGPVAAPADARPPLPPASVSIPARSAVRRPVETAISSSPLITEPKPRIPLVDDQTRVHILE